MAPRQPKGPEAWIPLPLDKGLFANLDQDAIQGYQTAVENGFVNELGGHTRFPGLKIFADLGNRDRVYLYDYAGDMIAGTSKGQIFRVDEAARVNNVTGVPVAGGRRVIFTASDREIFAAAGGPIIRLRTDKTELLSENAPLTTHVAWIDGYVVAPEMNSLRWFHSDPGVPDSWPSQNTFTADGNPDNINSLLITPFRELLFGGDKSVEQFERLTTGTAPFFRRWAVGDGVKFPYCQVFADNAMWTISKRTQLVRFSQQSSAVASVEIGQLLEKVDDWTDAWIGGYPETPLHTIGQAFLILQIPRATNPYGTKGITLGYDYRHKKYFSLYGFDPQRGLPIRWPGWSHWNIWNRNFVGGEGVIYEVTDDVHSHAGAIQRWLVRTAHIAEKNQIQIKNLRLHVVRGMGTPNTRATLRVRCSREGRPFGPWISRDLGFAGDRIQFKEYGSFGTGTSFMFEFSSTDDCPINLMKAEVKADPIGH